MQVENNYCDSIAAKQLPHHLNESLEKLASKEGYKTHKIISKEISTDGGNYLAVLYEVVIKGQTNDGDEETHIFIKHVISQEHIKLFDLSNLYAKELFFYTDLKNVIMQLENEASVPYNERYKSVKCYEQSNTQAIILENITNKGFTTMHRMDVMPIKFAELSVQQLAKFHAISFVIENRLPQYFDRKIKSIEKSFNFDEQFENYCRNLYECSVKELDSETRMKLDKKLPEFLDNYPKYLEGNTKVKCLCHGDYRMNNIMMKIVEGEITNVIPVDYQLMLYGSPVIDLIYLIFSATDREFRRNHLENLKKMYFATLERYLKYFKINIESTYPREEFEKDYEDCLDYGIHVGVFILPFVFTREDSVPDLSKTALLDLEYSVDQRFHGRLKGVIDDMIQWGKL